MPIIQAVDRALRILDLFDEYKTELKITDISKRMALHKSTVHSLLKTLQVYHYIEQNPDNRKYRLGMGLFERGNLVIRGLDIRTTSKKQLQDLSMKTGQTTNLVILDGIEGIYIDKVEGTSGTILYSRIGRRIPIHCSAVGKALLVNSSEEELNKILDGYIFNSHTPNTIINKKDFLKELESVRTLGHAIDNQENELGVRCIAAPIKNHLGQVIAAISISTPVLSMKNEEMKNILSLLKQAADKISQQMGYEFRSLYT